jgi:4Fe-4S dicluster domain
MGFDCALANAEARRDLLVGMGDDDMVHYFALAPGQSGNAHPRWEEIAGRCLTCGNCTYRQWMTHKLAHWVDQFGSSGCGRCITWCPVGIDITEEAAAIQASPERFDSGQ